MTIASFKRSALARLMALTTLISFLATFLPPRVARASDADALAEIPQGAAGVSTVGGSPGAANAPETLAAVDLATGAVKTSYAFRLPKARGDAQPSLSLAYSSSSGVGFAGMSWTLNLPSIVRKGHAGIPRFQDAALEANTPPGLLGDPSTDDYYIDGALLIPVNIPFPTAILPAVSGDLQGFRCEVDDGARYFLIQGTTWIKQTKSGHVLQFGLPLDGGSASVERADLTTAETFAVAPAPGLGPVGPNGIVPNSIYRWNLVRDTDASGNTVYYVWDDEHQLLGTAASGNHAAVPTAGTMYLTDIYDTSNVPNPQPPLSTTPPAQPAQPTGTCSPTCPDNGSCTSNSDCASFVCASGVCKQPSCAPLCNQGAPCGSDDDCGSLVCGGIAHGGGTCLPPVCSPSCGPGSPCNNNGDCESFVCGNGVCQPPNCSPTCNQGAPCGVGGDCGSGVCSAGRCAPPACSPTCANGSACNNSGDCTSFVCGGNKCKSPSCAPTCGVGNPCGANGDCRSNACIGGKCVGATGMLDDLLGMVEKEAYAQQQPATTFAHHVHLTWALPDYPGYPTELGSGTSLPTEYGLGLLVAPYAYSPIWKAVPLAQLATVDVFSASWSSPDRQLVREYQLQYGYNNTQTLSFLASVQLVGDCDSVGGIPETGITAALVSSCASVEHEPPTTYSYYGIGPRDFDPPSRAAAAGSPPTILAQTLAFSLAVQQTSTTLPPDMLIDLNGDGVADLVAGANGAAEADPCFGLFSEPEGCIPFDDPYIPSSCTFPTNTNCFPTDITGPDQYTFGPSSFETTAANGLTTVDADDSMWTFSVMADWQSTGRNSFLEILPPTRYSPTRFSFTNSGALPIYLGQLSDPSSGQVALQSLMAGFPTADLSSLERYMGYNGGSPILLANNFRPNRAFDVDGDGLPDMALLPTTLGAQGIPFGVPGTPPFAFVATFLSTRDRTGVTHPFQALAAGHFASPGMDPTLPPLGSTTQSKAVRALADMDGDGLADLVIVNKYDASYNTGTNGPTSYVGLTVLPNRGDGRFGVPNNTVGNPWDGYGNAVLPGYSPDPDFQPITPPSDPVAPDSMQQSQISFGDLNGDGMADFAVLDSAELHVCLRYGAWWDSAHWQCVTTPTSASANNVLFPSIMVGDLDGSGIRQVVAFSPNLSGGTAFLVSPSGGRTGPRDGLLQSVSNGLGGQTSFSYDTVHDLGLGNVPVPVWVATQSTTTNGLTGAQAVSVQKSYSYATPLYDARDQLFVGFRSMTEVTLGAGAGSPGTAVKTTFATATDYDCASLNPAFHPSCTTVPEAAIRASRGLVQLVEVGEPLSTRFSSTVYTYVFGNPYNGLDGRSGVSISSRTVSTYLWDATQNGQPATGAGVSLVLGVALPSPNPMLPVSGTQISTSSTFDVNDDETLTLDSGAAGTDQAILTKRTWSLPLGDETGWGHRVMQSQTGYANGAGTDFGAGQPVREMDYAYDSQGRLTKVSAPLMGALNLPGPGGAPRAAGAVPPGAVSTSPVTLRLIQYDPNFGNVTVVGNQDNPCLTNVAYDPLFQQLPSTETQLPNGCGTPGLVTSMVFDRRVEQVTSTINPSLQVAVARYDDFGRVAEVDEPDLKSIGGTVAVLHEDYEDVAPVRRVHVQKGVGAFSPGATQAPAFVDQFRYVDGLGETRAVVDSVDPASHPRQSWVLSGVHSSYANGRAQGAYRPQFTGGPSVPGALPPDVAAPSGTPTHWAYDGLGRITSSADVLGNTTSAVYNTAGLSVVLVDAEQSSGSHMGSSTQITRDGHGRTVASDVHLANGPQGSSGDLITTVTYQATGEPTSITQTSPSGVVEREMGYDSLGRMVQNTEPNAGTWTYAYNAEGQLVGTSDARGCGENIYYDPGGRILAADYSPCLPPPAQQPYSAPTIAPGVFPYPGAEESYAYDFSGRLTNVADRARSDSYGYWTGMTLSEVDRQLALPGAAGAPVSYGVTHGKFFNEYSVAGQVLQWQLETLTPERLGLPVALAGSFHGPGSSPIQVTETTTLGVDGSVAQITATTSGTLLAGQTFNADGTAHSQTFGDAAQTQGVYGYDNNGRLTSYSLVRGPGPWVSDVTPVSAPGDASQIGDLTDLVIVPDRVGNPVSVTDSSTAVWPQGTARPIAQTYSYWDDYRLRSAVATSAPDAFVNPYAHEQSIGSTLYPQPSTPSTNQRPNNQSFQYDWRGNVTSSTDDADDFFDRSLGTVTGTHGSDRFSGATSSSGASSLTPQYDQAGNMVSLALQTAGVVTVQYTYTWDELGQLASATRADDTGAIVQESYLYGAGGQRLQTSKSVNGSEPLYTLNVFDSMVLKNAPLANGDYVDDVTTEQLYMAGGLARVFDDVSCPAGEVTCPGSSAPGTMPQVPGTTNSSTIHTFMSLGDTRGSASFVIDHDTGELVERTTYQPYGALDSDSRSQRWESSREDVKFTGQWDNAEVGVVYFGARYYSPQLGRFISPDPLTIHGLGGDPNPYAYAYGSPFAYTDPTGLDPGASSGWPSGFSGLGSSGCYEAGMCSSGSGPQPGDWDFMGPVGSGQLQLPTVTIVGQAPPGGNDPTQMADFDNSPPQDPPPFQDLGGPGYDGTVAENNVAAAAAVQNFVVDFPSGAYPIPQLSEIIASYTSQFRAPVPAAGHGRGTYDYVTGGLLAASMLGGGAFGGSEGTAAEGLASNAANAPRLAMQLAQQEAESAFTATGELSQEAIQGARQIIPPGQLGNPAIPQGFGKFSTQTFQSPSGPFQVHFYMNRSTGETFYGLDFKAIFNGEQGPTYFQPFSGSAP